MHCVRMRDMGHESRAGVKYWKDGDEGGDEVKDSQALNWEDAQV